MVAHNARIPDGVLERGTQSLAHRGPDDSGTILLRDSVPDPVEIGLGNRRLAILDLSPLAHQPMHDAETGNWIVYNGEIYNFRSVRDELLKAGTSFVSHSDTEVVLKSLMPEVGVRQCLDKIPRDVPRLSLSGMCAAIAFSLPAIPWGSSRSTMQRPVHILSFCFRSTHAARYRRRAVPRQSCRSH